MSSRDPFSLGGHTIEAGTRSQFELPLPRLITGADMGLPVVVVHGEHDGPIVWINAAIHGDEINGVEIVTRVLGSIDEKQFSGTLIAVPVVNVHGFISGDRYLPDRRDLNRSFPGSKKGSLASRIANEFMNQIVLRADVGIDLHAASDNRTNLPQIRANLDDERTNHLAHVFGSPVTMHSNPGAGTLRRAAANAGKTVLLFEGGEPYRFNDWAIDAGVNGVLRVLAELDMTAPLNGIASARSHTSRGRKWVRASRSGIVRLNVENGDIVESGQVIGQISDAFGETLASVKSPETGIVIGKTMYPLSNQGDALVHVAKIEP